MEYKETLLSMHVNAKP